MEAVVKKARLEVFELPFSNSSKHIAEKFEESYQKAITSHPFYDNAHSIADVYESCAFRDGKGNIVGILLKEGLPEYAATMAANVLRPAATKTSLRANINAGEAPNSGIAGYFDYLGSPIEFKYRKTAFTYENEHQWKDVFPMIDYVSQIYKRVLPDSWAKQDASIPDLVRIHGSPFSTLTINSRFRTASHTDAGDFGEGFGCITCLEGKFKGLALTFDKFKVNVVMRPRDVVIFDTHHFHSNTELEQQSDDWSRLTCVFYYRAVLGEPAAYREYQRRLQNLLCNPNGTPPSIFEIIQKKRSLSIKKISIVYPLQLTPFLFTGVVFCLAHCASQGLSVHQWMLQAGSAAEELLFGEPLQVGDGIPQRRSDELEHVHTSYGFYKAPAMGGFKECDITLQTAASYEAYLHTSYLQQHLNQELLNMWTEARCRWLKLVKEVWLKLTAKDLQRTNFQWNNRSDMNVAFFDLCAAAKEVMLSLLNKEIATPAEEQSFWAIYAAHLHTACIKELMMPPDAISIKKLNVKLKDYNFGGTRYFKDMPEVEQQRRLERKKFEAARRKGTASLSRGDWLANDAFDYQTEDALVDYDGINHITPECNAQRFTQDFDIKDTNIISTIELLVILPSSHNDLANGYTLENEEELSKSFEWPRLIGNAAAQRLLSGLHRCNDTLPIDVVRNNLHITYAFVNKEPEKTFDFVILQHVLTTMNDEAARQYVDRVVQITKGCVIVGETNALCRRHYLLKNEVRLEHERVAPVCFQKLHYAKYGVINAFVRTKPQLESLFTDSAVWYKLEGSPLNTVLIIIPGRR